MTGIIPLSNIILDFRKADGSLNAGGTLEFFENLTLTPKAVFDGYGSSTQLANPLQLNAGGFEPGAWLGSGAYRVRLRETAPTFPGVLGPVVWTKDNVNISFASSIAQTGNAIVNGSFEDGTDGTTAGAPVNWTLTTYTGSTFLVDPVDASHGGFSAKCTSTGNGGATLVTNSFTAVGNSEVVVWKLRTKSTVADVRNIVSIAWYTVAQVLISTTSIIDNSTTNPAAWTVRTGTTTAPANAAFYKVTLVGCSPSDPTEGSTWFDGVEFGSLPRQEIANTWTAVQTFSAANIYTGANAHSGVETHSGAEIHSGAETHSGAEIHTGAETHSGIETFPTAAAGTNTTQAATTAFVQSAFIVNWFQPVALGNALALGATLNAAITSLNSTDIAYISASEEQLKTMRFNGTDWLTIGNLLNIAAIGIPAISAMSGSTIAYADADLEALRKYGFDGTNWAQVGNSFSITPCTIPALAAMNTTDVVFIDSAVGNLRMIRFDGTNWAQVGNALALGAVGGTALAAINGTDVVLASDTLNVIRVYRFDGTDFTLVGNSLAVTMGTPALTVLNRRTFVFVDSTNQSLRTYDFDQTNIALLANTALAVTSGSPSLTTLNGLDIAMVDDLGDTLRNYRYRFYVGPVPYHP